MHDPLALGTSAQAWAHDNPAVAEIAFVLIFVLLTMTALPVWWLQVLAGYAYGLFGGTIRCAIAASIAATITAQLWRWLAADLADHTIMRRVRVLHMLKHYSSDGGFLVVIITRLVHLVPFGLSNYLFGMLEIPWHAVLLGTAIGVVPSAASLRVYWRRGELAYTVAVRADDWPDRDCRAGRGRTALREASSSSASRPGPRAVSGQLSQSMPRAV